MGTNFYMMTEDKKIKEKYFGYNYELTDTPKWGYSIHIAKTSGGWLPLFQKHDCIQSVADIKKLYDTGHFIIYDEYDTIYNWSEFEDRVIKFNGGIKGVVKQTPQKSPINEHRELIPISHFDYDSGRHAYLYSKDDEGYEFMDSDFF